MRLTSFCTFLATSVALQATPYISKVWEYRPAPGQFVNTMPMATAEDTPSTMAGKATQALAHHNQQMITLGAYGGYVVLGFDHEIKNIHDQYDLKILGNAFYAADPEPSDTRRKGSSEPGIVMVSRDDNRNGLPDDAWYELAGSEYYLSTTRHRYTMSYCRPDSNHQPTPDNQQKFLTDTTYIRWFASQGETGYLYKNAFHKQDYYPLWLPDTLSFTGTIMSGNATEKNSMGQNEVSYCFDYGYADNQPNELPNEPNMHASEFDLDWAVDSMGNPVYLEAIQFVKIYTGLMQDNGWLGECSTEILDAWDMHPDGATFECQPGQVQLAQLDTVWQGANTPLPGINLWMSGGYRFTTYMDDYGTAQYYYAFTVSSETDSTSTGWEQPYRSACGGAYQGNNFCVWNQDYYGNDTIFNRVDWSNEHLGVMVTNTAYTVKAMKDSYRMATSFTNQDWLALYFIGIRNHQVTDTVTFFLAQNGQYVRDWTFVDLSSLGQVDGLLLSIDGSDKGDWGLNTPTYAAIDNLGMPCPPDYTAPAMVHFENPTDLDNTTSTVTQPVKCIDHGRLRIMVHGQWYDIMGRPCPTR